MADIFPDFKKPLLATVLYGEDINNSVFKALQVDENGNIQIYAGNDGTNNTKLLTDNNGQLLVGNDGTNAKYIKTDTDGQVFIANRISKDPISKVSMLNQIIIDTTNILSSDISPTFTPALFRIYIALDIAARVDVIRTSGLTTVREYLNAGNVLNENAAYMFDILVDDGETINLQAYIDGSNSTTATLLKLSIVEKPQVA